MRLIDADALIKILEPHSMRNGAALGWHSGLIDAVIDEIRKMPTIGGWISVKDSMPEQQGEYLINTRCIVTIGWFSGTNGWVANDGSFYGDGYVTHWMPLPEPPEEEK